MNNPTSAPNGSNLCLECALCCDGSLFLKAQLRPHEPEHAYTLGLTVFEKDEQPGFHLPCHLLNGKACSIYEKNERPHVCGSFRCELLKRYLTGEVDLDSALKTVQTTRSLLAEIQQMMPFGSDKQVTFRAIHLMVAYISSLTEQERKQHTVLLDAITRYIRIVAREFLKPQVSTDNDLAIVEMDAQLPVQTVM
jgi:hypothetical protein